MRTFTILLASAAFVASTAIASAQSPKEQTPAVSPAQTQQNPGGADGGLGPNETSKTGQNSAAGRQPGAEIRHHRRRREERPGSGFQHGRAERRVAGRQRGCAVDQADRTEPFDEIVRGVT